MNLQKSATVSNSDFINELTNEVNFMKKGGTTYRRKTAELSLDVAKVVKNVNNFYNRDVAYKTVADILSFEDEYRLEDVAKMLNVVLLDIHSKVNQSDELKTYLVERARNRKPLKLIPVS
jgi:signal transduction histidine kinase